MLFLVSQKVQTTVHIWVDGNLIEHPDLLKEKRARMKILLFDPTKDLPIAKIKQILEMALKLRQEK